MSIDQYKKQQFENEVYFKLKEAELEAKSTNKKYTHKEVFKKLRERVNGGEKR